MATNSDHSASALAEPRAVAQDIPQSTTRPQEDLPVPTPVEMSKLTSESQSSAQNGQASVEPAQVAAGSERVPRGPIRTDTNTAMLQSENPPPPLPSSAATAPGAMTRTFTTAIGPSSDKPVDAIKDAESAGPTMMITLLLTSGARHPFRLDGKYLTKRNVQVPGNDPFNLSVYKLKELILREWREEWEAKPSSPSYIRLISFGKLLDDKAALKDLKLNNDTPNVVHMTIKPQDFVDEEDAKGGKAPYQSGRENETSSPGCRCIIM